jgi:hypothetical protein
MSVQAQSSRLYPISSSFRYNGSLVTWTVVCLTAANFKPLIVSMSGFNLSNITNIFVIMILYDFTELLNCSLYRLGMGHPQKTPEVTLKYL